MVSPCIAPKVVARMYFELAEKDADALLAEAFKEEAAAKANGKAAKTKSQEKRRKDNERRWKCRKAAKAPP